MLHAECSCHVNETARTAALVFEALGSHWDERVEGEILRVDDVTSAGERASWVGIDDLQHAEVRVIDANGKRDRLAGCVLHDVIHGLACVAVGAGEVGDHATKNSACNEGQRIHLAVLGED